MDKWDYNVVKLSVDVGHPTEMPATLDGYGDEGWELVSAQYEFHPMTMGGEKETETCIYFFKRRRPSAGNSSTRT
ncbi:MAG: hypothetical protein ABJF23_09510 [Bryobacteraceae bacterium]